MKFIYFGSFHISAGILEFLMSAGLVPAAVVCNPDKPAGRDKILTPPAIKQLIIDKGWTIPLLQPEKPVEILAELKKINADFFVVMGYPKILPMEIISLPRLGTIGVHPSRLPWYRGPSPIQSAVLAGETTSAVTLYLMDEGVDHGPILSVQEFPIATDGTNASVEKKVIPIAGTLLARTLPQFYNGEITARPQNEADAQHMTKKFTSADGEVNIAKDDAIYIYRRIAALNPEPGVWTRQFPGHEGRRVKLLSAKAHDGIVTVTEMQVEGKKPAACNLILEQQG